MLRLKNLANKYQKRTCRPLYANTQATPYAANLTTDYRDELGALDLPATVFTYKGSLVPGMVVTRLTDSEEVKVVTGDDATAAQYPFGLLANFVGGDLDEGFSGDSLQNSVGVWRGPDAVFEILAPAFDDAGSETVDGQSLDAGITEASTSGECLLFAGDDGRLVSIASGDRGTRVPVARLVEKASATRIIVDLKV